MGKIHFAMSGFVYRCDYFMNLRSSGGVVFLTLQNEQHVTKGRRGLILATCARCILTEN